MGCTFFLSSYFATITTATTVPPSVAITTTAAATEASPLVITAITPTASMSEGKCVCYSVLDNKLTFSPTYRDDELISLT